MTDKTQAEDTSIQAEKVWFKLLQKVSIETRIQQYYTSFTAVFIMGRPQTFRGTSLQGFDCDVKSSIF